MPPRNRYRPITSSDNAATTGLAVNPVGAMIPVSDPTNGAYGPSGQYGAMLPQVNVASNLPPGTRYQGTGSFLAGNRFNPDVNMGGPQAQMTNPNFYAAISSMVNRQPLPQTNFTTANSFYTPPQINTQSANSFTSAAGGVNLQPGLNNNQFVASLGERLLQNPAEYDNLPKSAQDAIQQALGGTGGPGGVNADPANSPGGRFIQVGEVRWERNKNGRLVKVQYTGGGSWRNKKVVQGGKGQAKRRLAAQGVQEVQPGNSNIPSYGVVNMSLNTGTG